jgi:hypothetical protein
MLMDEISQARKVSTPLIAIITADQFSTVRTIREKYNPFKEAKTKEEKFPPVILWDTIKGLSPLNKEGEQVISSIYIKSPEDRQQYQNITETLVAMERLPQRGMIICCNANHYLDKPENLQAIMNLRDSFKSNNRTLIMLGVDFQLPLELSQDVLILDEPLPTETEISTSLTKLLTTNEIKFDDDLIKGAVDALRGLASFPIEQAAALSIEVIDKKPQVNIQSMWQRKKRMLQQIRGLSMEMPLFSFNDLGGLAQIKLFTKQLFSGPRRPRVICYMDEIEKMFGGLAHGGDTSGTSTDQLGVTLTTMEKYGWPGHMAVGPAGTAKSAHAQAMAATHKIPLLPIDLGAAKGSLVGQSEQQIRAIMKAILAIAGEGGAYFVATCNKLDILPPELRRRFRFGIWYFDLPNSEERKAIGKLQTAKLKIPNDPNFWADDCDGWSGANIRDCVELAFAMALDVSKASSYIVPAAKQDPNGLERLRDMADTKFLSASYAGPYIKNREVELSALKGRAMDFSEA